MPNTTRDRIAAEVRAELARQQKAQKDLVEFMGLPQPSVSLRLIGRRSFRAEELVDIAEWLGVSVEQLTGRRVAA